MRELVSRERGGRDVGRGRERVEDRNDDELEDESRRG